MGGPVEHTAAVSHTTLLTDSRLLTVSAISFVGTFAGGAVAPVLPSIATAFGVSDAAIGLVMAAVNLPGVLLVPVLAMLADVYGRRVVLLPALAVFGLAGVAIAVVDTFAALIALRLVQGMVAGAIIPLAITILGDLYTGPTGTTAQGLRLSANGISQIAIPAIAGFLAGISWRYPFFLFAVAFPALALGYVFVPRTVKSSATDRSVLEVLRAYVGTLRDVAEPALLVLVSSGFFRGFTWMALLTFVPLFAVRELGATPFEAGALLSLVGVVRTVVSPLTGTVLTVASRRTTLVLALLTAALGAAVVTAAPSVLALGAVIVLYSLGDSLFIPILIDTVTERTSDRNRAGAVGSMSVLRRLGVSISPVAFGVLLGVTGFTAVFVLAGLVLGSYAVVLLVYLD